MIAIAQIHWIAGLLEGEGSFCFTTPATKRSSPSIRIALAMLDKDIVYRLANVLGFGSICLVTPMPSAKWPRNSAPTTQHRWECAGVNAAGLMMTIYPLMSERRQAKIRELLAHYKSTGAARYHVRKRKFFA